VNPITLTVIDVNGNISTCVATVTVEDQIAPAAICQNITLQLDPTGNAAITALDIDNGSSDACGIDTMFVSPFAFNCANIGNNPVTLTVIDVNGNISTCAAVVTVEDNVAPTALCHDINVQLDISGNATITAFDIDNGSSDGCGIDTMFVTPSAFTCGDIGLNTVTLTVIDMQGNLSTCVATVTVSENTLPIALCQNITIQLDPLGAATITAADIDNGSSDACGIDTMFVSPSVFGCANVGNNNVVLTVVDGSGNTSTCNATVTVVDNLPPVALCTNLNVYLDFMGNASISAADVDNGSADACGIASMNVTPNTFTCADVGPVNVTLMVTDNNGNVSSCTSVVTVFDTISPLAGCQNIVLPLDAVGTVTLLPQDVNNASFDACGFTMAVSPNTFDCSNIGPNTVTLTLTDANGNISSCTSVVTIVDNTPPAALCHDLTLSLDPLGNASIVPADVDNGSSDACGIASLSVLPNIFSCNNVGTNFVTLTVTDVNGNISTCVSVVTVNDTVSPIVNCPAGIYQPSLPGACDADVLELGYPTFTDNCSVSAIVNNGVSTYPIGQTVVMWTVTDGAGNSSNCAQTIIVVSSPLAVNDTVTTAENTPVLIPVLANDVDCIGDLDPASLLVINGPDHGTVSINYLTGDITYTPDNMFTGSDQFDYQICDSTGLCSMARVFITVTSVSHPLIGIAKAVTNIKQQEDGNYLVTFVITVENMGNEVLSHIQVTDSLAEFFNWPVSYTIVEAPVANDNLTPNQLFNGNEDANLLESSSSYLNVGQTATITFTIRVVISGSSQSFCNSATATAAGQFGVLVSDISQNGFHADVNGNGLPDDPGESECTPLTLLSSDVFIPQGFSPDKDGINDYFVIRGIEDYPDNELTIYNRWGNLIFHMKGYDNSWDGTAIEAELSLGKGPVQQGTYYYIFEYNKEDRAPRTGFIEIVY
jgi:gliding motility-associated-like protein